MEQAQIETLSRTELQSLAKERGIKANAKSKILIEKLVLWFEQNKENDVETNQRKPPKKKNSSEKDLDSMSRRELQILCKENDIRANQKTSKLLEMLKNIYATNNGDTEDSEKSTVKKKSVDDDVAKVIVRKDDDKKVNESTKKEKRHSTLKAFDTSPAVQYGSRRRKSLKAKQLLSFNDIFDEAMNEEKTTENKKQREEDEKTIKKERKIYVKSLKCKPFKTKKSKRPTTAPKAFNLSSSNYGSHKKRNRDGEPLKPTWKMKTKPLPPFHGDSLFSPKKSRKRNRNAFDLQQSLSMPLTWVLKKGKLPSLRQ